MKTTSYLLTALVGLCITACGGDATLGANGEAQAASALTLPFPDEYFGMFLAREAAGYTDASSSCQARVESITHAWTQLQTTPQFQQLADTSPWGAIVGLRDGYAANGCFASGPTLDQPSDACQADFNGLVAAWQAVERTPQFNVLISGAANHDLYASWVDAVALRCVRKS